MGSPGDVAAALEIDADRHVPVRHESGFVAAG
jgi:hypothetical protein